jgi:protoporphyrinogen/coproporphyrinogen III oxidase
MKRGRVVVVGGGVAGLTTAYRVLEADPSADLLVLEAAEAPGGKLSAVRVGDLTLEAGPDSFVARKPWAAELCRELGLALVEPGARGAFVWTDAGLVPLPVTALGITGEIDGFGRWPGMSKRGRARALTDLVKKPSRREEEESLGALVRRRLGDEAADVLVQPLLGGLFAGDIDRLGVRATFPELATWERTHGSLIRGAKAALTASTSAGPLFLTPADGASALPRALGERWGPERISTGSAVTRIAQDGAGFGVATVAGEHHAGAVVLATPAFVSASLLERTAPAAADALAQIRYVSTAVVLLVYPPGTGTTLPDATGFVVPSGKAPMTAATFLSRKWPSAAFGDRAVLRCFVGGAGAEDVVEAPDSDIVQAVSRHLAAVLPLPATPQASEVVRWPRAMPQYEVGHLERVAAIEASLPPGIFVVGNAYRGVGVADTVRNANEVAERVRTHLAGDERSSEREHVR